MTSRATPATLPLLTVLYSSATLVACSQTTMYGAEFMPLGESRAVLQSDATSKPLSGHVDKNFQPLPGREVAKATNGGYELEFVSLDAGRMCVRTEAKGLYEDSTKNGRRGAHDQVVGVWSSRRTLVFEARVSFDDVTDKTLWPSSSPTSLDSVKATETSRVHTGNLFGGRPGFRLT